LLTELASFGNMEYRISKNYRLTHAMQLLASGTIERPTRSILHQKRPVSRCRKIGDENVDSLAGWQ
jgi:hypothetical protein